MKKLTVIAISVLLAACSRDFLDRSRELKFPSLPPELKDCRIFGITNSEGESMRVARCPNSTTSTTYKSGKTTHTTVVIDGVEYVQK